MPPAVFLSFQQNLRLACYNNYVMFRKILSVVTLALLAVVIWKAWPEITNTFGCLFTDVCYDANGNVVDMALNPLVVLLLIPEQLFMYFCAGQIFFSYI